MNVNAHLCHLENSINTSIAFSEDRHIVFHNFQHIILELNLNAKGIVLLSYICEKMGDENQILINDDFKKQFIEFVKEISGLSIEISTINTLLKKFKLKYLLIERFDYPQLYVVNPKYYSKSSSNTKRKKLIEGLLSIEFEGKINKEALLNRPIESFFK
jgi:hypothetical protein